VSVFEDAVIPVCVILFACWLFYVYTMFTKTAHCSLICRKKYLLNEGDKLSETVQKLSETIMHVKLSLKLHFLQLYLLTNNNG